LSRTLVQQKTGASAAAATTVTATLSPAATPRNIIICAVGMDKSAGVITSPAGFKEIIRQDSASVSTWVGWREAFGGETGVTLTRATASTAGDSMVLFEYSDTNPGEWTIFGQAWDLTTEATRTVTPSGTTLATQAVGDALAFFTIDSGQSNSGTPSYTNGYTQLLNYTATGKGEVAVAHLADVAAGTLATTTQTHSPTVDQTSGVIIVFGTGPGTAPPPVPNFAPARNPRAARRIIGRAQPQGVAIVDTGFYTGTATQDVASSGSATGQAQGSATQNVATSGSSTGQGQGTATQAVTDTTSATGQAQGSAAQAVAASSSATGSGTGAATQAVTDTPSATGQAQGSATLAVTVSTTATGSLVGSYSGTATQTVTVGTSAAGNLVGSATQTVTVSTLATGNPSGTAAQTVTDTTSATGQARGTASQTVTVGTSATGALAGAGVATQAVTVGTSAAGQITFFGTASQAVTASPSSTGLAQGTATQNVTAGASSVAQAQATAAEVATVSTTAAGGLVYAGTATKTITVTTSAVGGIFHGRDLDFVDIVGSDRFIDRILEEPQ
jgi:hypothetical protein